ncbi:MAG: M23 family metallopeptidase [Halanaerobiales bacterium]|nr:M23 family metallopeptidase [Halanaerobiales bacterium]
MIKKFDGLIHDIKEFLSEKLYITITPSTRNKVKRINFKRYFLLLFTVILIILLVTSFFKYYLYKAKYIELSNQFTKHKESTNDKKLQEENKNLKKNLLLISQNTEELISSMRVIKDKNKEIRDILGEEIEDDGNLNKSPNFITSVFEYNSQILNQGPPIGGRQLNLYYYDTDKLVKSINNEIATVDQQIKEQKKVQEILKNKVIKHKDINKAVPKIWPLADAGNAYISSEFGWRNDPISGRREYHDGLDIAVWYNTPILATATGEVTFSGWNGGFGWYVEIDHGYGYKTYYAHLNKLKVSKGDQVEIGEIIGLSGNSGKSTGPHLHYEVRINGVLKNPRKYIGG